MKALNDVNGKELRERFDWLAKTTSTNDIPVQPIDHKNPNPAAGREPMGAVENPVDLRGWKSLSFYLSIFGSTLFPNFPRS